MHATCMHALKMVTDVSKLNGRLIKNYSSMDGLKSAK